MGDFNVNVLVSDRGIQQFQSIISFLSLRQIVDSSTRVTLTSEFILDFILISSEIKVFRYVVCDAFASDLRRICRFAAEEAIPFCMSLSFT